jgi:hypothetical protein
MEFEVGQVIKVKNANYLIVNIDNEGDTLHLYDTKERKIVYGVLSLAKTKNQLWTNINILSIVPKEQIYIVKIP